MANFDQVEMAVANIGNYVLYDDKEMPGVYVWIPKFKLSDVLSTDDDSTHPAFLVDGVEKDGIYIGKFQTVHHNGRAYSLALQNPTASANLDTFVSYARAKGGNFHEITAAEWAAIALWCHKNGFEPRGNNNYGKDVSETQYVAKAMTTGTDGKTSRVATGSGPITWSHDGTIKGIWDMNGNIMEWCTGIRLVYGEVQIIENNNAASPTCDLSATSSAWKAINASTGALVTPDGSGTTSGTVKMDYVNSVWTYTTLISGTTGARGCSFKNVVCDSTIGDAAKLLLQSLAMLPDTDLTGDDIDASYSNDYFYANNSEAERCLIRGGYWYDGSNAGLFYSSLANARSHSNTNIGGRSASYPD